MRSSSITVLYQVLNKQVPVPVPVAVVQVPVQVPVHNLQVQVPVPIRNLQVPVPVQLLCIMDVHPMGEMTHVASLKFKGGREKCLKFCIM